ncbi:hypothetical protein HN446_00960 [bacterium]|jgi:hypothetical protein|nr:hypothetical protein [bacterium]
MNVKLILAITLFIIHSRVFCGDLERLFHGLDEFELSYISSNPRLLLSLRMKHEKARNQYFLATAIMAAAYFDTRRFLQIMSLEPEPPESVKNAMRQTDSADERAKIRCDWLCKKPDDSIAPELQEALLEIEEERYKRYKNKHILAAINYLKPIVEGQIHLVI